MTDLIKKATNIISDIRLLIDQSKLNISKTINSQMTILYWHIGERIRQEIIGGERAEYGEQIVKNLAKTLTIEYGKGFGKVNLSYMVKFYEFIQDVQIVQTLSEQLSWSHIIELLPLKTKAEREFYAYMAIESGWSVRQLRYNIRIMTYDRTIASQKTNIHIKLPTISREQKEELIQPDILLKDPYILDFLQLSDNYYEDDLEKAILNEIEKFLLELGVGFSFIARQKRIQIGADHFYIDLLLYNRKLRRMCCIELKKGKFKAQHKGQMELYLNYLRINETYPGEEAPIGIILCTEKDYSQVELLDLNNSGIHVAEYWTELPPKEIFEKKIQQIVLNARKKLDNHTIENNQND